MSNLIFPALPGVKMGVKRTPIHSTKVQTSGSGREARASWQAAPRYKYGLQFEFARSTSAYGEFQRLANFLSRHAGQYDTFLFQDPEDAAVIDHGCGVGNGVATAFQLQRTLGVTVQDALGTWPQYTKPRTNFMLRSQEFDNAAWSKTQGGTGSVAVVTPNYGEAPDGTITADLVQFRLNGGTTSSDTSNIGQSKTTRVGVSYASSVWLKTADGSTKLAVLEPGSGVASSTITVNGTWQRFTAPWAAFSTFGSLLVRLRGGTVQTSDSADLLAWGAQYEEGVVATKYIPTTSAALTQSPAFWPAIGDGFEPVYDPAPGLQLLLTDWQGLRALLPYSRTNLAIRSEEIDSASWTKSNATVTPNATTAPDGTPSVVDKLVENGATAEHYASVPIAAADNATIVQSCWAKAAERTSIHFAFVTKAGAFPGARFNLTTGTVAATFNGATASIVAYPDGWYRCTISASIGSGGTSPASRAYVSNGSATNYAGDGTSGVYVWGMHAEVSLVGAVATPYIKTLGSTVTFTDYAVGSNSVVTLAVPPLAGAALSWTGSFYRRVRCNSDAVESERIFDRIWQTSSLELLSWKP